MSPPNLLLREAVRNARQPSVLEGKVKPLRHRCDWCVSHGSSSDWRSSSFPLLAPRKRAVVNQPVNKVMPFALLTALALR
jgi:hypothetical protein